MKNEQKRTHLKRDWFHRAMYPDINSPELYESYFNKQIWSAEEFGALMAGLTPERWEEIDINLTVEYTSPEIKLWREANHLMIQFLEWSNKTKSKDVRRHDGRTIMSCWKFIKWTALNEIPIKKKFLEGLPLTLLELLHEFQPINQTLLKSPRCSTSYHRALYLKHAKELIDTTPHKLSKKEIYHHPHMQNVMDQFKDANGKRKHYKRRTVMESWLPKIDKQSRGRPKKQPKHSKNRV